MAEPEGAWSEPVLDSVVEESPSPAAGLEGELDLLEARVLDAAILIQQLREERDGFARERETLFRECGDLRRDCETLRRDRDALRREREEAAARLAQIIAKVDALRGEP